MRGIGRLCSMHNIGAAFLQGDHATSILRSLRRYMHVSQIFVTEEANDQVLRRTLYMCIALRGRQHPRRVTCQRPYMLPRKTTSRCNPPLEIILSSQGSGNRTPWRRVVE